MQNSYWNKKAGNVSEIAYRCGFNSPAYFIKCFKDQYGTTLEKCYNG
ncbi:MAG: AraC family transcriptional regulator [Saprospiraceae bacterium]|nr:AraC family transcriptional regulator [Saprospiraceae bacterium]